MGSKNFIKGFASGIIFILICWACFYIGNMFYFKPKAFKKELEVSLKPPPLSKENEKLDIFLNSQIMLKYPQSDTLQFSSRRGEVLFVNLWATWCIPCIAELPSITRLKNKLKENGRVKFYIVSNETQKKLSTFFERNKFDLDKTTQQLPFYTLVSDREVFDELALPTTLILYNGKIVYKHVGAAKWDDDHVVSYINNILSTPKSESNSL
ncbi:TlpA family protein disulfide reductase [Pontibacter arcticus]|uniref:Thioredoxin domain-containing protein n=1 Tax=Pontibacter arcticus TaxID=2080288 RepID=A0A364RGT5_9BACT|nr:TlpA disulfide reductase family protein [Pontibacter arcticus]RAU83519.1 hypothetical protein DP923_00080 [Pontibacter arcticus]